MAVFSLFLGLNLHLPINTSQTGSGPTPSDFMWGFASRSVVKNPPAMQEMRVRSLGGEDPLEKEMATHSSVLAWRIPWTEEPGEL